ncbi:hypothetical protein K435DRAFT_889866 [Dendrothele bispora CBS 962.96]|uniref:Uncharacterized protein n=1 Tax=Dendrothele bispora (strain CBS 962.96) TaxID=1314807 RepID=A0A4S8KQE8_DENBC|nr:hypothetical protein K435DRAFT_889866 [Dendrothele bispora CBS 962.96]
MRGPLRISRQHKLGGGKRAVDLPASRCEVLQYMNYVHVIKYYNLWYYGTHHSGRGRTMGTWERMNACTHRRNRGLQNIGKGACERQEGACKHREVHANVRKGIRTLEEACRRQEVHSRVMSGNRGPQWLEDNFLDSTKHQTNEDEGTVVPEVVATSNEGVNQWMRFQWSARIGVLPESQQQKYEQLKRYYRAENVKLEDIEGTDCGLGVDVEHIIRCYIPLVHPRALPELGDDSGSGHVITFQFVVIPSVDDGVIERDGTYDYSLKGRYNLSIKQGGRVAGSEREELKDSTHMTAVPT